MNVLSFKKKALNIEPIRTTDHGPSNNRQVRSSSHSETIIGDHTLRWPTFEMHNAFFKGNLTKRKELNI
jgi:hypothetical protein